MHSPASTSRHVSWRLLHVPFALLVQHLGEEAANCLAEEGPSFLTSRRQGPLGCGAREHRESGEATDAVWVVEVVEASDTFRASSPTDSCARRSRFAIDAALLAESSRGTRKRRVRPTSGERVRVLVTGPGSPRSQSS